ncbi:glycogen/starch synthase [Treponema sp. OMZ 840]|uniref:glycogen synthase n=1 Tax=Treponema sp. OMZ 840 TaxID=244313 RepID=UPI003D900B77
MNEQKTIWLVSREYAGIAEAGGVKNVVRALAEQLYQNNFNVCVFIPLYGCTAVQKIRDFKIREHAARIKAENREYTLHFAEGLFHHISFVFIIHSLFTEKSGVYTYTEAEERLNHRHMQGKGHEDALLLNVLFQKGVLEYGRLCAAKDIKRNSIPDIIHCHDAAAALIPFIARNDALYDNTYNTTRFVLTIHNAGNAYRHEIDKDRAALFLQLPEHLFDGCVISGCCEPYLLAEPYAELTTVSPWYAKELTDPRDANSGGLSAVFARRNTRITGITNGIEYDTYNPANISVSMLPHTFNPSAGDFTGKYRCRKEFIEYYSNPFHKKNRPELKQYGFLLPPDTMPIPDSTMPDTNGLHKTVFFSYHGRMVHQKGTNILADAAKIVLKNCDYVRFIVTGQGNTELEKQQEALADQFPGKYLYLRGYERSAARLCVAVADFIVLPSIFEPCGLEDFIAQLYGTIPIAHACGGLQKIVDGKTGFLYADNTPDTLARILSALAAKKQKNPDFFTALAAKAAQYVQNEYSWKKIISTAYIPLYENVCKNV